MRGFKFLFSVSISIILLTGCSLVTKLKEKLTSSKENTLTKENTKEMTKDATSDQDLNFYNKYIEVMNKIQESGENVNKYYLTDVPSPGSVTKNSLIIPVSFKLSVQTLGSTAKNYSRSLLDGGELSKLKASPDMQRELENDLKELLPAMEQYKTVSEKVSEYYSEREYKNDLSKVKPYDEEMKSSYENYKTAFNKFSSDLKKYKPKRKIYDPTTASDPDEASSQVMLNAYGNILDAAEIFYDSFENVNFKGDITQADAKLRELEKTFNESRSSVQNAQFSEKVKFMKYNFEDYFSSSVENFLKAGTDFFDNFSGFKNENEFRKKYNDIISKYNLMINSYNSNIGTINTVRSF